MDEYVVISLTYLLISRILIEYLKPRLPFAAGFPLTLEALAAAMATAVLTAVETSDMEGLTLFRIKILGEFCQNLIECLEFRFYFYDFGNF